jgi:hypothetical protein
MPIGDPAGYNTAGYNTARQNATAKPTITKPMKNLYNTTKSNLSTLYNATSKRLNSLVESMKPSTSSGLTTESVGARLNKMYTESQRSREGGKRRTRRVRKVRRLRKTLRTHSNKRQKSHH